MKIQKDFRPLLKAAKDAGWTLHERDKGILLRAPDGKSTQMIHGSNSDFRAVKNLRASLRRAGVRV